MAQFARASESLQWQQEHIRLGGAIPSGLNDDKIEESGVMCRKTRKLMLKRPSVKNSVPRPWVLYWSEVRKGGEAPDAKIPLASRGRRRFRQKKLRKPPEAHKKLLAYHKNLWHCNSGLRAAYQAKYGRLMAARQSQRVEQPQVGQRTSLDPPPQLLWGAGTIDSPLSMENLAKTIAEHSAGVQIAGIPGGISAGRKIIEQNDDKYLVTFPTP